MASASDMRFTIAKLNNSNYQLWKFKLEMLLSKDDLWQVLDTDRPNDNPEEWDKKNRQAKAVISLLVEDDQLIHIRKENTAKGMWTALQRLHERANLNSKLYLLRKLYKMRLEKGQEMGEHINAMLEIVNQLGAIGEEMKDNHAVALLLCSLPESYSALINALETRPETELTLEYVKGKLIDEYSRRKENLHSEENEGSEIALKVHEGTRQSKETRVCFRCKKAGHLKKNCSIWKAEQRKREPPTRERAKAVMKEYKSASWSGTFKVTQNSTSSGWYIDSGATSHMTSDETFFTEIDFSVKDKVFLANGKSITAEGNGQGFLNCKTPSGGKQSILIKNVLYVPSLEGSLLSVKTLASNGLTVQFRGDECTIQNGKQILARGDLNEHLYKLVTESAKAKVATHNPHDKCIHLWHRRLGHRNPEAIKDLVKRGLSEDMKISPCQTLSKCTCCIKAKATRTPLPQTSQRKTTKPIELIHSDVCGPMKTVTPGGNRYLLTFIDDYSRYTTTYLIKHKSETLEKLQEFVAMTSNKFQRKPGIIRTDNGGEYMNKETESYLKKQGIIHQTTVPYTPEQNGVAERKNRTLIEMARCMISDAALPNKYWGEAIMTATYLQNRLPSKAIESTPYEMWNGSKPNVGHVRVFGCKVYALIPSEKRSKLENKAIEGILVGYSEQSKGYRILCPKTNKVTVSRSVYFNESEAPDNRILEKCGKDSHTESARDTDPCETEQVPQEEVELTINEPVEPTEQQEIRRFTRTTKGIPPRRLSYAAKVHQLQEPTSWEDIKTLPRREADQWRKAAEEEIKSLQENNTWSLTELPPGRKTIGSKWTFKVKYDAEGNIYRYKARLVAKGYSQKFGEDYDETFAPVVKHSTMRTLLSVAAGKRMQVKHLDVKTAFLHGDIKEDLYMEQPPGFEKEKDLVCKLQKSIYGLKQAARVWNEKVNEILTKEGFSRSKADPCLYSKNQEDKWTYILIYVDDILTCFEQEGDYDQIVHKLKQHFEIKELGDITHYLGIQIEREEDGSYLLNQNQKITEILEQFHMQDAKEVRTPMEPDYLKYNGTENLLPNNDYYRRAIGKLLYIATVTRPDIAAAVGILCRKVASPCQRDWNAVKRVMQYLKGTNRMKLRLPASSNPKLIGYVDADWAGDTTDRKSTSGYIFQYGKGAISWSSRKQMTVALSSTEAEYIAAAYACQEAVWIRQLLLDMGLNMSQPTPIFEDNQGCIKLAQSEKVNPRTKHIDVKYHLLRDMQEQGVIDIQYCPSEEMTADALTKPLPRERHCILLKGLNVVE